MNQYSMANSITLSRAEMAEISEKMAENRMLKNTIETYNATITKLNKENKDLKKDIKKLQDETKAKEQDMKKKFMELHLEQKKVNGELNKYEAVPEFKEILELYEKLLVLRNKMDAVVNNNEGSKEKHNWERKIEEYKLSNEKLEATLRIHGAKIKAKINSNELQQAEMELNCAHEMAKKQNNSSVATISEMKAKMKNATVKMAETIRNSIKEVEKQLTKFEKDLDNIKEACSAPPETPSYEKIVNILLQHQNSLMKDMLLSGISVSNINLDTSTSAKDDTQSVYDSDCDSIDEDDVRSVRDNDKYYKVIMSNISEEQTDGLPDIEKVKAIIKTISTLSTDLIKMERMGKLDLPRKRMVKVLLPTFQHVQVLLKMRDELKNTCYAHVKIYSYKKKGVAGKQTNIRRGAQKKK